MWIPQKKLKAIRINKSLNSFDKPTQLFNYISDFRSLNLELLGKSCINSYSCSF